LLKKLVKIAFALILFSIYPTFVGLILFSFGTIYLIFLPMIVIFLLGLGWGIFGQHFESKNQNSVASENAAMILVYWPAYFLIKSIMEDSSARKYKKSKYKNYFTLVSKEFICTELCTDDIILALGRLISSSKGLDLSKAFKGYVNESDFRLRSNMYFSIVFGNRHVGQLRTNQLGDILIEYRSSVGICSKLMFILLAIIAAVMFIYGITVNIINQDFTLLINSIIAPLMIFIFSFVVYVLPFNIKRIREYNLIIETIHGNTTTKSI
jgi:hypothetical protein